MGPVGKAYAALVAAGELRPDPDQKRGVQALDRLAAELAHAKPGLLAKLFGRTGDALPNLGNEVSPAADAVPAEGYFLSGESDAMPGGDGADAVSADLHAVPDRRVGDPVPDGRDQVPAGADSLSASCDPVQWRRNAVPAGANSPYQELNS